jgi:hypothetical protein
MPPSGDERDVATITPYRDGPLIVRGPFRVVDQDGVEVELDRTTSPCAAAADRPASRSATAATSSSGSDAPASASRVPD